MEPATIVLYKRGAWNAASKVVWNVMSGSSSMTRMEQLLQNVLNAEMY